MKKNTNSASRWNNEGLKVSWKLYAPYSQWKSHLENPQRSQRAEVGTAQPALQEPQSEFVKPAPAPVEKVAPQPVHQVQVRFYRRIDCVSHLH